jgi:hypothetical protein
VVAEDNTAFGRFNGIIERIRYWVRVRVRYGSIREITPFFTHEFYSGGREEEIKIPSLLSVPSLRLTWPHFRGCHMELLAAGLGA